MTNYVWKFKDKNTGREALYGNVRELCKNETITIDGRIKQEEQIRYLLRGKDSFSNNEYLIIKTEVTRSRFKRK
jgi:hypothetical protein|tara:strand:- start:943 stop:1164 length:222 start_codon:yes stop_codon:yes gene_type:complete